MPQILTPARLATLIGVLTGLSAAATSLLNIFPASTSVGRAIVAAAGVLATVISVAKFLEGQTAWETTNANNDHELAVNEQVHQHNIELINGPALVPVVAPSTNPPATLDEEAHLSAGLGA